MKFDCPIGLNIFSPLSLRQPMDFLDAVRTYCNLLPSMTPEKWGWWEPLDRKFDLVEFERLIATMGRCDTIFWKRSRQPKSEGTFLVRWNSKSKRLRDTHAKINLTVERRHVGQDDLINWLQVATVRSRGHLAFMDIITDAYRDFAIASESAPYGDGFLLSTHVLRHWLPDVFWATVFGPPYVKLFGKERLLSAPVSIAKELAEDVVYLQLTDSIGDVVVDPFALRERRDGVKRHLNIDAFFDEIRKYDRSEKGPIGDVFVVPEFDLEFEN
ncbi:hypothetical protein [Burkholderia cepacia]|uniref:hypothetical protein n=1 Tax=Burkholderia cepacia TaxID=292 RepID=UPI000A7C8043|nr:hypothetical protein [Burkholderia cepacia]